MITKPQENFYFFTASNLRDYNKYLRPQYHAGTFLY